MLDFVDLEEDLRIAETPDNQQQPLEPARAPAEIPKNLSTGPSSSPVPGGAPGSTGTGGGGGGGSGAPHAPASDGGGISSHAPSGPATGGAVSPMDTYDPGPPGVSDQSFWGTHDHPISGALYATGGTGSYSFSVDTGPSDGTVALDPSGNFTYTPNYHFYGVDRFTFIATDTNDGESSTAAAASLTVQETAPSVGNYTYTILHDQVFGVNAPGVLQDSTDGEGDSLTASLASGPASAKSFELNADGSWAYEPSDGYLGDDSFTFNVTDGIMTVTGTVTIHVVDQKPVAQADQYYFSATDTQEVIGQQAGVQANDSDPDEGDTLKSYVVTGPNSGSLTMNTDGSFTYTPVPSYIAQGATVTFSYKDSDGAMYSDTETVTMYFIHVHITNPAPSGGGVIDQPADANGDGNDFTFDASNPGVLTLPVKATVTPDNQDVRNHLFMEVIADPIGGSSSSETGFQYASGQWIDTLTYTGLPAVNTDFGNKELTVYALPGDSDSEPYQVFFDRNATNHPGGDDTDPNTTSARSPNWYHYWSQVVSAPNMYYNSTLSVYGRTPAMRLWSPTMTWAKDEIWIAPSGDGSDTRRDGTNQRVDGIDLFANIIAHEEVHVQQIASADALLGSNLGQPGYVGGWSWNTNPNNHSIPDGMGGMTNLDTNNNDIPDSWEPYSIEGAAEAAENVPQNTYWQSDWASPGKQHRTDQLDTD